LFREQVGQTPQQWVERERMARAMQLLALSSRTIANIAAEVGYDNPFYFSLRFKQHTGRSPRDWRQRAAHQQPSGDAMAEGRPEPLA
jgi:AraC family transcriptional regulator of arabinose operon